MTDKERLERLEKMSDNVSLNGAMSTHLRLSDLLFLIKQAGLVLRPEKEVIGLRGRLVHDERRFQVLKDFIRRADFTGRTKHGSYDFNEDIEWLVRQVGKGEGDRRKLIRLCESWKKMKQKEFALCAENQRLKRRVEMLECASRVSNSTEDSSALVIGENQNLKIDNKRCREALEFYANKDNYKDNVVGQWGPVNPVQEDGGDKARKELEGKK